jgi:hypothetical protein
MEFVTLHRKDGTESTDSKDLDIFLPPKKEYAKDLQA